MKINKEHDKRTAIRQSSIPNAGDGLFAVVRIKKGEVIGELGGRLFSADDFPPNDHYIASLPECAWDRAYPYKYIDAREHAGNVSRINFAPSKINGVDTHFQNAAIEQLCEEPYFIFIASRDIEPGEEIWSSYGPNYDYDPFMQLTEIQAFFCALSRIDCSSEFNYSD